MTSVIAWIILVVLAKTNACPEGLEDFCSAVHAMHQQCDQHVDVNLDDIKFELKELIESSQALGSVSNPAASCNEIRRNTSQLLNRLYYIRDSEGNVFQTYCDMTTSGGGWTLIASMHENNMKGRCTSGDRWSSEQGNSVDHPHGDGFWGNRATHGIASSSTSDDYKNSGYFAMTARDIMIWHVPNDTPIERYESAAFIKYHTDSGFLQSYGGNLGSLFSDYFDMRSKEFQKSTDNGPAISIIWDRGSNNEMIEFHGSKTKNEIEPGYIQFRVINNERNAFALCSGVRIKAGKGNVEHACFGSTSNNIGHEDEEKYCGDFAAADWTQESGWSTNPLLYNSAVMIFYR